MSSRCSQRCEQREYATANLVNNVFMLILSILTFMASGPCVLTFLCCSRRIMKGLPYYRDFSEAGLNQYVRHTSSVVYIACGCAMVSPRGCLSFEVGLDLMRDACYAGDCDVFVTEHARLWIGSGKNKTNSHLILSLTQSKTHRKHGARIRRLY